MRAASAETRSRDLASCLEQAQLGRPRWPPRIRSCVLLRRARLGDLFAGVCPWRSRRVTSARTRLAHQLMGIRRGWLARPAACGLINSRPQSSYSSGRAWAGQGTDDLQQSWGSTPVLAPWRGVGSSRWRAHRAFGPCFRWPIHSTAPARLLVEPPLFDLLNSPGSACLRRLPKASLSIHFQNANQELARAVLSAASSSRALAGVPNVRNQSRAVTRLGVGASFTAPHSVDGSSAEEGPSRRHRRYLAVGARSGSSAWSHVADSREIPRDAAQPAWARGRSRAQSKRHTPPSPAASGRSSPR